MFLNIFVDKYNEKTKLTIFKLHISLIKVISFISMKVLNATNMQQLAS